VRQLCEPCELCERHQNLWNLRNLWIRSRIDEISVPLRALPAIASLFAQARPPAEQARRTGEAGGSVKEISSSLMLLTKGLVLGSSCSGELTIINQKTHRGGWANEQDPISFGERWGFCG